MYIHTHTYIHLYSSFRTLSIPFPSYHRNHQPNDYNDNDTNFTSLHFTSEEKRREYTEKEMKILNGLCDVDAIYLILSIFLPFFLFFQPYNQSINMCDVFHL